MANANARIAWLESRLQEEKKTSMMALSVLYKTAAERAAMGQVADDLLNGTMGDEAEYNPKEELQDMARDAIEAGLTLGIDHTVDVKAEELNNAIVGVLCDDGRGGERSQLQQWLKENHENLKTNDWSQQLADKIGVQPRTHGAVRAPMGMVVLPKNSVEEAVQEAKRLLKDANDNVEQLRSNADHWVMRMACLMRHSDRKFEIAEEYRRQVQQLLQSDAHSLALCELAVDPRGSFKQAEIDFDAAFGPLRNPPRTVRPARAGDVTCVNLVMGHDPDPGVSEDGALSSMYKMLAPIEVEAGLVFDEMAGSLREQDETILPFSEVDRDFAEMNPEQVPLLNALLEASDNYAT